MITRENLSTEVIRLKTRLLFEGKSKKAVARSLESLIVMTLSDDNFNLSEGDIAFGNSLMKKETGKEMSLFMIGITE